MYQFKKRIVFQYDQIDDSNEVDLDEDSENNNKESFENELEETDDESEDESENENFHVQKKYGLAKLFIL